MNFISKIFIPNNKWFSKYSFTEKCYVISILSIVLFGLALVFFDFEKIHYSLKTILQIIGTSSGISLVISMFGPYLETEPLYGNFSENITISENGIIFKNILYPYQDFKLFDIKLNSYFGAKTGNVKLGPRYFQGINNELFFIAGGITFNQNFLISTEIQFELLTKLIDNVIIEEKIPFRNRYLYLISKNAKTSNKYLEFTEKLKKEKRIYTK